MTNINKNVEEEKYVKISKGMYGNSHLIQDKVFQTYNSKLEKGHRGLFINVINTEYNEYPKRILKIWIDNKDHVKVLDKKPEKKIKALENNIKEKTDVQLRAEIKDNFDLMEDLTLSCANGQIKGLVISGAPGTGKSYNIQKILEENDFENIVLDETSDDDIDNELSLDDSEEEERKYYLMCKGKVTPLSLYKLLYDNKDAVLVFDDCDSIFHDHVSLNILKSALDSYSRRIISYNTSAVGFKYPKRFEFEGRIIFVSNLYMDSFKANSKTRLHVDALMSRCHFLDLGINSIREKVLRIQQSIDDGLLENYDLTTKQKSEILTFIKKNQISFREISLRTALKIADTMKISPTKWKKMAHLTCLGGRSKVVMEDD